MWIEVVGAVGMVMMVVGFLLASSQKISDHNYLYHVLNLMGSVGVFLNAYSKGVAAVWAIEVAWGGIALVGIITVYRAQRRSHALE